MFGKPQWFRKKTVGWGLRPVSWKGWAFALLWACVICLPFVGLLAQRRVLESLIWVVAAMAGLLWDVRGVMRAMDGPTPTGAEASGQEIGREDPDLLVIDENTEPDPSYFATRSYDLHIRR